MTATLLLTPTSRPTRGRGVRWRLVLLTVALLVFAHPPAGAEAARTIKLSGEPLTQRLVSDLAYFYRRETPRAPRFSIVGGGTAGGIADAARGIVDAGLVSRGLAPGEPKLTMTPIALSAICLVTNPANPVGNLTRAQIQALVSGTLTDWSQVPGSPLAEPIVPVTFDEASGARLVFESTFLDIGTPIAYSPRTFTMSTQMRDFIVATRSAIGYLDVQYTSRLHVVPYEGIACNRNTVRNGSYPARRPLGFVTRGRPRGELRRFLRWIRRDATAKRVIRTRYVVPS